MKKIAIMSILATIFTSYSCLAEWKNVLSCDGGIFVIDSIATNQQYPNGQLVLRGHLAYWLIDLNVSKELQVNTKGEIILHANRDSERGGFVLASNINSTGTCLRFRSQPERLEVVRGYENDSYCQGNIDRVIETYNFNNCQGY